MKRKLTKKLTALTLTAVMLLSIFGTLGSAVFAEETGEETTVTSPTGLDLDITTDSTTGGYDESVSIDQGYATTDENIFADTDSVPNIVRVSWTINQVTITRITNKVWDSSSLSWKDADEVYDNKNKLSAFASNASATFTLDNYIVDQEINATVKYTPATDKPVKDLKINDTAITAATDGSYSQTDQLVTCTDVTQPTTKEYAVTFTPDTASMSQEQIKTLDGKEKTDTYGSYTVTIAGENTGEAEEAEVKAEEGTKTTSNVSYQLTGKNASSNTFGTTLTSADLLASTGQVTYTYNDKTCIAYNGYIPNTAYANWADADTFVQKLNDAEIAPSGKTYGTESGQGTWRLLESEADARAWTKATNGNESDSGLIFGDVYYLWSSAVDDSDDGNDWDCLDGEWLDDDESDSSSFGGFVVVWEQN